MTQTLCILGRQPALGLAELESLYGAEDLRPIGSFAVLIDREPATIDFSRLGGTVKFCKLLTILDTVEWSVIQKFLEENVAPHVAYLPEGKMKLGFSVYGVDVSVQRLNASALAVKKVIKNTGRSVRVVPNAEKVLNSAQVLHNQLTSALGWELIFVRDGQRTIVAQNIAEQDIEAYARRDQSRPKRDARVGMLPPKLAQIIINLAAGPAAPIDASCGDLPRLGKAVLDPFCGTGVILQEAALMGYDAIGTDLDPRMIEYSHINVAEWLVPLHHLAASIETEVGDATSFTWKTPFDMVASEAYLGRAFSSPPTSPDLSETVQDVNSILKKFLQNLARQTKPGLRLCVAIPAWKVAGGFRHLPLLDQLAALGYRRLTFSHAKNDELVYHRTDQIVARELTVLERI